MPEVPDTAAMEVAPDWVCETLSSSTSRVDRAKMSVYAAHGVSHSWVVDPESRILEVRRLEQGCWLILEVFSGSGVMRAEPFDAVEIKLDLLWGATPQDA
jgi:Uma2 family endonuclease